MLCGSCSPEICICLAWKNTPRSMVICYDPVVYGASLMAQRLKHLPPMWDTWVRSLGWEDPLEKEMVTHSSILAWRIPWAEEPGGLQSTGSQRVGHHLATERVHTRATQRVYPQGQPGITLRVWILHFQNSCVSASTPSVLIISQEAAMRRWTLSEGGHAQ